MRAGAGLHPGLGRPGHCAAAAFQAAASAALDVFIVAEKLLFGSGASG